MSVGNFGPKKMSEQHNFDYIFCRCSN